MTHPGGRPRKLTPEQESRVYETITSLCKGSCRRYRAYVRLSNELGVGVSTLERIVGQHCRRAGNIKTPIEDLYRSLLESRP